MAEIGAAEVGSDEIGAAEVGFRELRKNLTMLLPPPIPGFRALPENLDVLFVRHRVEQPAEGGSSGPYAGSSARTSMPTRKPSPPTATSTSRTMPRTRHAAPSTLASLGSTTTLEPSGG